MEIIEKYCQTCCDLLKRKDGESGPNWRKRKHCNNQCSADDPRRKSKKTKGRQPRTTTRDTSYPYPRSER